MHVKPYHYYTKDTNISNLKTINNLIKNLEDKLINKEISIPLVCLKSQKLY